MNDYCMLYNYLTALSHGKYSLIIKQLISNNGNIKSVLFSIAGGGTKLNNSNSKKIYFLFSEVFLCYI